MATTSFLVSHNITVASSDTKHVQEALDKAFAVFVSRLASLLAVTTLSHGTHIASNIHVDEARRLLFRVVDMRGGGMPSEFYSNPNASYGMGYLNLNTDTIDFYNDVARPEMSTAMTGGRRILSLPLHVQQIVAAMKVYKVNCSTSASNAIVVLVSEYFAALASALKAKTAKGTISYKNLNATLRLKKFALFN